VDDCLLAQELLKVARILTSGPPRSFSKTFEGPNGNEAVAYEWRWKWDEVYSKREDGLVSAKVSDWDNAEKCKSCGRKIVHVYWVKDKETGKVEPYGADHLHVALGYRRELSKSQVEGIQRKVTNLEAQAKEEKRQREEYEQKVKLRAFKIKGDPKQAMQQANIAFSKYGSHPLMGKRPVVWLWNKSKDLLMRGDDFAVKRFLRMMSGWQAIEPGKVREVVT